MFDDVQFPTDISRGSRGGPRFNTDIVRVNSGFEVRTPQWLDPLFEFNARYGVKRHSQLQAMHEFFLAAMGKTYGFRYKNWLDYIATLQPTGTSITIDGAAFDGITPRVGSRQLQLRRLYSHAQRSYAKDIRKPTSAGITMRKNAGAFTDFILDDTNGVVTLDLVAAEQSEINFAAGGVSSTVQITWVSHGLVTGDVIWIEGETVETQWNNRTWEITFVDVDNFTINSPTGGSSSGGDAYVFAHGPNFIQTFDWTGQFDLPCRFDIDFLDISLDEFEAGNISSIPIVETRDFI